MYEFPLHYQADDQDYDVGNIQIFVNLNDMYQRMFRKILVILGTQAFKTFTVSLFIFFIVQWVVTRHLKKIANFIKESNVENLDQTLQIDQPDGVENELTKVADAINLMRDELNQHVRSLKKRESRYRALLENAPIIILQLSPSGTIEDLNLQAELLYNQGEDEILGQNFFKKTFSLERQDKIIEDMDRVVRGKSIKDFEASFINRSGKKHQILWNIAPFLDDQKNASGVIAIGMDVTENKTLESQLQQAQKMESVGRLAGGVAHDFNNMLSIIMGYADLTLDKLEKDDRLYKYVAEIHAAGLRSTDIVRQLLAFARKQTVLPKVLDLNENIESMLNMLRRLLGEDIEITWLPDTDIWPVKIDPSQVHQIFANLCVNARDAMVEGGKLIIETRNVVFDEEYCASHVGFTPGSFVLLAVSDTGQGMTPEIQDKIFDPFFTTKGLHKGTGLGLSTVYGIVKQNNGFINVYSEPGKGTTFRIYLPQHEGKAERVPFEATDELPLSRGETILLVEDEASILKLGKRMLEALGYRVLPANTVSQAIELTKKHADTINLLVTDVIMPEMNGRELSEQLIKLCPGLQVLFMSGYTADVIAHRGELEKGVHFISKPLSKNELARKIRKILDAAPETQQ